MNANTSSLLPVAGQHFAGGIFSHVYMHGAERRALILSPKAEGELREMRWHAKYGMVAGALSYFDGLANTRAMAEAGSELARRLLDLRIGGKDDWCLPALDQLEPCYRIFKPCTRKNYCWARSGINLSAIPPTWPYTPDSPIQTGLEAFRENGELLDGMASEAFEAAAYWTSTQHAADVGCAWLQDFDDGNQDYGGKGYRFLARAVRSEPI